MSPQEKAKEMYDKMLNSDIMNMTKYCAKQCALIAVDEIIGSIPNNYAFKGAYLQYWQQVKTEIEKL